jgi:menaquinone-dependent protoporphyrinogen oxidase
VLNHNAQSALSPMSLCRTRARLESLGGSDLRATVQRKEEQMTVLVTAASKHGATLEIGEAIARALDEHDVSAEFVGIDDVSDLGPYEAVVLGSAVYMGHWVEPARKFVERFGGDLAERKTWLFSSGPIGDAARAPEEAVKVDDIIAATKASEHRLFAGKFDKSMFSFPERAIMRAVGAKEGDYRDWDEIDRWAAEIAEQVRRRP